MKTNYAEKIWRRSLSNVDRDYIDDIHLQDGVDPAEEQIADNMIQSVVITFDNGETAIFTGKAAIYPGTDAKIENIKFTEPQPLEDGYSLEPLKEITRDKFG